MLTDKTRKKLQTCFYINKLFYCKGACITDVSNNFDIHILKEHLLQYIKILILGKTINMFNIWEQ